MAMFDYSKRRCALEAPVRSQLLSGELFYTRSYTRVLVSSVGYPDLNLKTWSWCLEVIKRKAYQVNSKPEEIAMLLTGHEPIRHISFRYRW